jgi:iron complex outermembrane receptor protein
LGSLFFDLYFIATLLRFEILFCCILYFWGMKNTYILLVVFFLFLSGNSIGQVCTYSLSGIVSDIHNDAPISAIEIYIKELNKKVETDSLGRFQFSSLCPGRYTIVCSNRDGYKPIVKMFDVQDNVVYNFKIEVHLKELAEVKISTLSKPKDKLSTLHTSLLFGDELEKNRGTNLGDIVKSIPGVNTLNTGNSVSKPVIHGMHSNRVLILNNGIRQEGQQWGSEHAPEIDPFIADKISVVKGANSIMYGSDAIAGVILIDTKTLPDSVKIGGEVNVVGNSNGRGGTVASFLEGKFKQVPAFSWRIQGTLKQNGTIAAPDYLLINTGLKEYNFSYELGWKKKNYGAELFYSQFNTTLGIFGASHIGNLTDLQRAFDSKVPLETTSFTYAIKRPYQHVEHELFKAKYFLNTGNIGKLTLVYARQYNWRYEYDKHGPLNDALAAKDQPSLEFHLTTHTLDVNWSHARRSGFKGTIGMNGMLQSNTYRGRMLVPSFESNAIGFFLIENWQYKRWELEAGLRYDVKQLSVYQSEKTVDNQSILVKTSHPFEQATASLGANYTVDTTWKVLLNLGIAWRAPSVNELYSNGLHHGAAAVEYGNSSLKVEQAYVISLTGLYTPHEDLHIEVSPYYNYISGFIYRQPTPTPVLTIRGAFPGFNYTQTDAILRGVDVFASYHFTHWLEWKVKGSMLRAWNQGANNWLILMPADRIETEFGFHWDHNQRLKHIYIGPSIQYVAKQHRVPEGSDFVDPPSAYWLTSLHIATHFRMGRNHAEIGLQITNLLNTRYRDYMDRFRYFTDAMGRNVSLRMKYRF